MKNVIYHKYDPDDRIAWKKMRDQLTRANGFRVGGSDVGTIMGLNEYKAPHALYYELLGLKQPKDVMNAHMYRGIALEEPIMKKWWQFFDPNVPTIEQCMANAEVKHTVRKCQRLYSIVTNTNLPNLIANLDFVIPKCAYNPRGILEIKAPYASNFDKWKAGIPPSYVVQVQVYMLVMGLDYGEVFALLDATVPRHFPFDASTELQKNIIEITNDFLDRVRQANKAIRECLSPDEAWDIAHKHEPDQQFTEAYLQFLKEDFWPERKEQVVEGPEELKRSVVEIAMLRQQKEAIEQHILEREIVIRDSFRNYNTREFSFAGIGNISWKNKLYIPYNKFLKDGIS